MNKIQTNLCDFHNITMETALSSVKNMSQTTGLDIVITPNTDHLVRLSNESTDSLLHKIYQSAALCLCDSKILAKLLQIKGKNITEVIPGSTLTYQLFEEVLSDDDEVLIIGGNNDVITKLRDRYPTLSISHHNPPMGFINRDDEVKEVINRTKTINPNYIFLAVGSPRQEILASILKKEVNSKSVVLCIGASILFIVGEEKRAPLWVQKLYCEWLYRMFQDPSRLVSRYTKNFLSLPKVYNKL